MEWITDILLDALLDSLKLLPFLFGAYLFLEYLEHRGSAKMQALLAGSRRSGPFWGALLGCVPQCGFSVAAANLYAGHAITLGTLLAVFISTSDEAVPVLIAYPDKLPLVGALLLSKAAIALITGLLVDLFLSRRTRAGEPAPGLFCECCDESDGIFLSALRHTAATFCFVFLISLVLGAGIELLGSARLGALLLNGSFLQPVIAAVLGLIPNCAVSVALTGLFAEGSISFGSLVAGLSSGSGLGLMVLFRVNPDRRQNARILLLLTAVGTGAGILLQALLRI